MIKKNTLAILLTASGLASPLAAHAVPVTYDFSGTGKLCTYTGVGMNTSCEAGKAFTGTMIVDVIAPGPNGDDVFTDGQTYADDLFGWVDSDFTIQWDGGTFNPDVVPYTSSYVHKGEVLNNFSGVLDGMYNSEQYDGCHEGVCPTSKAGLLRQTYDLNWINDLSFNPLLALAPGAGAINRIYFENTVDTYDFNEKHSNYTGFTGEIDLSSMTARASTAVPEPGSLALMGAGVLAVGLVRRRRNQKSAAIFA